MKKSGYMTITKKITEVSDNGGCMVACGNRKHMHYTACYMPLFIYCQTFKTKIWKHYFLKIRKLLLKKDRQN